MMRVLLTGASGFVGRNCSQLLHDLGFEVFAVHHNNSVPAPSPVRWVSADLMSHDDVARILREVRPTHLLHLAWYAVPGQFWTAPENLQWLEASKHLLRQFLSNGGRRAVIAGTCAEYSWSSGEDCVEDVTPVDPSTLYARSKHDLHLFARELASAEGAELAWARLFWMYGPYEHPQRLLPSIAIPLLRSEPARCNQPELLRDFLHVEDVARGVCQLLASSFVGAINISSGAAVRIGELVTTLATYLHKRELLTCDAAAAPPLTGSRVVGDNRRLVNEVGWTPTYSFSDGVRHVAEWWSTDPDARMISRGGGA